MTEFEKMNYEQRMNVVDGVVAGDVSCCLTAANFLRQAAELMETPVPDFLKVDA